MKDVVHISVKKGEMTTHKIVKTKFPQLNSKRFYFPNAIFSLPFGHPALKDTDRYKRNKEQRTEKYFWMEKENLLKLEKESLKATPLLDFLNNILLQKPKIGNVDCTKFDRHTTLVYKEQRQQTILDITLSSGWKSKAESTSTTKSFKATYS